MIKFVESASFRCRCVLSIKVNISKLDKYFHGHYKSCSDQSLGQDNSPACWRSLWTEGDRAKDEHLVTPLTTLFWPGKQTELLLNIQAMSLVSLLSSTPAPLSSILRTPGNQILTDWNYLHNLLFKLHNLL